MTWQKNAMPTSRNNDICTLLGCSLQLWTLYNHLWWIKDELKAYKEFNLVQIISIEIDILKHLKQLSQCMKTDCLSYCATFYTNYNGNTIYHHFILKWPPIAGDTFCSYMSILYIWVLWLYPSVQNCTGTEFGQLTNTYRF